MKRLLVLLLAAIACGTLIAKEAAPLAADEAIEKRLNVLAEELRCLVCQNESLAGSRADLAEDLRREVRNLMKEGKTDEQVKEFLVSRYGDFVLYRPPVKPSTWLLWAGPFALLALGVGVLIVYLRRRTRTVRDEALTEDDIRRAQALLKEDKS